MPIERFDTSSTVIWKNNTECCAPNVIQEKKFSFFLNRIKIRFGSGFFGIFSGNEGLKMNFLKRAVSISGFIANQSELNSFNRI